MPQKYGIIQFRKFTQSVCTYRLNWARRTWMFNVHVNDGGDYSRYAALLRYVGSGMTD